jgi:hypothetical protein
VPEKQNKIEQVDSILKNMNQGYASNQAYIINEQSYREGNPTFGGLEVNNELLSNRDQFRIDYKKIWNSGNIYAANFDFLDGDEPENNTYLQDSIQDISIVDSPSSEGNSTTLITMTPKYDPEAIQKIEAQEGLDQDYESYVYNKTNTPNDQRLINFRRFLKDSEHASLIIAGTPNPDYEAIWEKYVGNAATDGVNVEIQDNPSIRLGVEFTDHSFVLPKPFTKEQASILSPESKTLFFDLSSEYNYTNDSFETWSTSLTTGQERTMPSFYNTITFQYASNPSKDVYEAQVLAPLELPKNTIPNSPDVQQSNFVFQNIYLNDYVAKWNSISVADTPENGVTELDEISQKNSNICFTAKNFNFLSEYNIRATDFPFYTDLELRTTKINELANFTNQAKLSKPLMQYLTEIPASGFPTDNFVISQKLITQKFSNEEASLAQKFLNDTSSAELPYLDLADWINMYQNDLELLMFDDDSVTFVGEREGEFLTDPAPQYSFYKTMLGFIFKQKYNQLIEKYTRTYKQIIEGKLAHSEVLFYQIQKLTFNNEGIESEPIQSFWIQNTSDLDIIKLLDTQVKYGKRYKYRIIAHTAVFGTSYFYQPAPQEASMNDGPDNWVEKEDPYKFQAASSPVVRVYAVEYYGFDQPESAEVLISDNPPIAPDVAFHPIRAERDKIFVYLNQGYDDFRHQPVVIQDSDVDTFDLIRQSQNYPKDDMLRFKSEGQVNQVEVFRIEPGPETGETKIPTTYKDFKDSLYMTRVANQLQALSFVDKIKINTKYYYCFRAVDPHGNISNPSPVFEVEMIGQDGSLLGYPVINVIEMNQKKIMNPKKSFNRYMNINPSPLQIEITPPQNPDDQLSAYDGPPKNMGLAGSSLFTLANTNDYSKVKRFKIRLTSKTSGKKIDVNVRFIHKHTE